MCFPDHYPERGEGKKARFTQILSTGKLCASLLMMRDTDTREKKKRTDRTWFYLLLLSF